MDRYYLLFWPCQFTHAFLFSKFKYSLPDFDSAAAVFDQSYQEIVKDKFDSILHKKLSKHCSYLIQFWAPIKVNGSTFLSSADQPFLLRRKLDKGLCSYRRSV